MFAKNKYRSFGLSRKSVAQFLATNSFQKTEINFKNRRIAISNPYWFLHSVDELFIEEVYKFSSSTSQPLIIDCGANWGLSIIYFKELYANAKILAFEPDPKIFEMLVQNVSSFQYEDVQVENKAVWNNNEVLFFSGDGGLGGTLTSLAVKKRIEVEVQAIRLQEILKMYEEIEFLKIDIEGAEFVVLEDCKNHLSHVKNLFVEYHSTPGQTQRLGELLHIFTAAGFRYYIKEAWNSMAHPFIADKNLYYDLQLNIFCYRP